MRYAIRHVTTYGYRQAVPFARCMLRMFPREEPGQRVEATDLVVSPLPSERQEGVCFFGNRTAMVAIDQPHRALTVTVTSTVEVEHAALAAFDLSPRWETVRAEAADSAGIDAQSPVQQLYPSRLIPLDAGARAYAATSFPAGCTIMDGARDLTARIKRDFIYDPEATVVSTPLSEALANRRGVCQDFAHIMIAGLRSIGLPAGYVSGYLRTIPPPGKKRLVGADATHAWVSVWCGDGIGWVGFDPTNDMLAGNDHIVVARGRDYADVSPIDGVIIGPGKQSLDVKVDVAPIG